MDENINAKRASNKQEIPYGYENNYSTYYSNTTSPHTNNQPLPGQPPLPPMPPPPGALPPLPHVFSTVPQVAQIQTWTHTTPTWQWIAPQAAAVTTQPSREAVTNNVSRGSYIRRDRFSHVRNTVYPSRNSFYRKNRRPSFDQAHFQFDPSFFGQSLTGMNIDWQRAGFTPAQSDTHVNHMAMSISNQLPHSGNNESQEIRGDSDEKMVSGTTTKKSKPRKPMSQNYPSRPWNRDDAQTALKVENEYNKSVRAQSLIIKFPDLDLNKDTVRKFHPGIQNIHFQSPSGPRYCFIQMSEDVNIDEAIKELEQIPFGVGHLKVERKSLKDEDHPVPEEIDPYTLYVGNLPESVNVNEVKSKFPTASRVDVGYAQKMRNTRYAFIRYTSVQESIAAYKKAHDLMWDTRSIIVRFRRQRGKTCLPGEPKTNSKRMEEANCSDMKKEYSNSNGSQQPHQRQQQENEMKNNLPNNSITSQHGNNMYSKTNTQQSVSSPSKESLKQEIQPWLSKGVSTALSSPVNNEEPTLITMIKEEPTDFDEIEMSFMRINEDNVGNDDDDDDDEDDNNDNDNHDDDDDDEPDELDVSNDEIDENDNEPDENKHETPLIHKEKKHNIPDHLDQMFDTLMNIVDEIEF